MKQTLFITGTDTGVGKTVRFNNGIAIAPAAAVGKFAAFSFKRMAKQRGKNLAFRRG